jgi:hypothetical protein
MSIFYLVAIQPLVGLSEAVDLEFRTPIAFFDNSHVVILPLG